MRLGGEDRRVKIEENKRVEVRLREGCRQGMRIGERARDKGRKAKWETG